MKKYLLSIILILSFAVFPSVSSADEFDSSVTEFQDAIYQSPEEDNILNNSNPKVTDPQDVVYKSSLKNFVRTLDDEEVYYDDHSIRQIDPYKMPVFKQMRLRLTNKYRTYAYGYKKRSSEPLSAKLKFWNKNKKTVSSNTEQGNDVASENSKSELSEAIDKTANIETSDSVILSGSVNKEKVEKQLLLDASNINFDDDTGDMVATGRPILFLPPQNTKIIADKMQYNDAGNILKAIGNVIVIRNGKPTHSDYLEVDMNEELITADNILAMSPRMNLSAEHGQQQEGLVILDKGRLYSDNSFVYKMRSRGIGAGINLMILDPDQEELFFGNPENHDLKINASYVKIDAGRNHDVIKAKNLRFTHNGKTFFKWPSITLYTDKEHSYFEGNYPELGSKRKLGAFIGPGFAFKGPFGSTMKVIPMLNYRDGFGAGALLKYVNSFNRTELGYGSANDIFFLRGQQKLDDNLTLQYSYNDYSREWFLGSRMPKYIAELVYDKTKMYKNFLAENMDMSFRQRATFGFMKDNDRNYNGEKFKNTSNMSTTRTRYMAEINQTLYNYINNENRLQFKFSLLLQGSAALYGTGDTQFVGRVGPNIRTQYKNWIQNISYFQAGYDDQTPLPRFDAYRYGKSSIRITEALRINKYLTIGWYGYVNLSDDAPNGKTFQENSFLISVGPDDFKVVLGYDTIRDRTYFGFNIAFDPKGTTINYDKMVIKNPEKLGKHPEDKEQKVAYAAPARPVQKSTGSKNFTAIRKSTPPKQRVLQYAQVINIEDPDKERIE